MRRASGVDPELCQQPCILFMVDLVGQLLKRFLHLLVLPLFAQFADHELLVELRGRLLSLENLKPGTFCSSVPVRRDFYAQAS